MPTTLQPLPPDLDQIAPFERPFTTAEYRTLVEAGVLGEDDRVELIDGRIVTMSPILPPHLHTLRRLTDLLAERLYATSPAPAQMSIQSSFALFDGTEPEPDLVLLRPDTPEDRLPGPADVLLVVEVSDSTLRYDRTVKRARYAEAGVPEMWVLDIAGRAVEVGRQPEGRAYRDLVRLAEGAEVGVAALPTLAPLPVSALFPPAS
jgi:Uma2 family endonuclease